jgi:hypothetical protein
MESPYAYLVLSVALFGAWIVLAAVRSDIRREMVRVSVGTMVLGLTEPLFVPEYWNPPTLGDLARRTGFDLESLLFSFAIGGIVFAAYHILFAGAPSESVAHERADARHRYHVLAILSAPITFVMLLALTTLNPIYAAAIALVAGFFATLYCRPDLWRKMLASGVLFLLLYFVVFALFNLAFPGYVPAVWNLKAVSGWLLWGVPFEELMFAFTFGLYWSSIYEHLAWRRTRWLSGIAHGRGEAQPVKGGERIP